MQCDILLEHSFKITIHTLTLGYTSCPQLKKIRRPSAVSIFSALHAEFSVYKATELFQRAEKQRTWTLLCCFRFSRDLQKRGDGTVRVKASYDQEKNEETEAVSRTERKRTSRRWVAARTPCSKHLLSGHAVSRGQSNCHKIDQVKFTTTRANSIDFEWTITLPSSLSLFYRSIPPSSLVTASCLYSLSTQLTRIEGIKCHFSSLIVDKGADEADDWPMVWFRIYLDGIRDVRYNYTIYGEKKCLEERGFTSWRNRDALDCIYSVSSFSVIWNYLQEVS